MTTRRPRKRTMTAPRPPDDSRFADEPRFTIHGTAAPPGMAWTDGPITYLVLRDHTGTLGAIWIARDGAAAGYLPAGLDTPERVDANLLWTRRIRAAQRADEWNPTAFLEWWLDVTGAGAMFLDGPHDADNLTAVPAVLIDGPTVA
jgi:hypothetical protein